MFGQKLSSIRDECGVESVKKRKRFENEGWDRKRMSYLHTPGKSRSLELRRSDLAIRDVSNPLKGGQHLPKHKHTKQKDKVRVRVRERVSRVKFRVRIRVRVIGQ